MNCDEFLATLDTNNPFYQKFCRYVKGSLSKDLIAYPKGKDLPERVQELQRKQFPPVVDQKLRMVIGVPEGAHQGIRNLLYAYHDAWKNPDADLPKPDMGATWYIMDGFGYYLSSMRPNIIVAGDVYRPDPFDKDLFMMLKVDTTI